MIDAMVPRAGRGPMLNPPQRVGNLDRDKLHRLLQRRSKGWIFRRRYAWRARNCSQVVRVADIAPADIAAELQFPLIVRPRGSHAGVGLAKVDDRRRDRRAISTERTSRNSSFPASSTMRAKTGCFANIASSSSTGKPYACHMAIADRWDIWYLNAGMSRQRGQASGGRDLHAHLRHRLRAAASIALAGMAERIGLDYFTIDCAENKRGDAV